MDLLLIESFFCLPFKSDSTEFHVTKRDFHSALLLLGFKINQQFILVIRKLMQEPDDNNQDPRHVTVTAVFGIERVKSLRMIKYITYIFGIQN